MVGAAAGDRPDHIPVLLDEVLKNLVQFDAGTYVDATFGRGGHSRGLLQALSVQGRVIGLDRDPLAVAQGRRLAEQDARFSIHHQRFSALAEVLRELGIASVHGILLDLGVSSPQLDDPGRGFSFRHAGPLDMRMDPQEGESAATWLNEADETDIARVIREFGEERFARRIARAIVGARPIATTQDLATLVAAAVPQRAQSKKHPATKTFQAIRIYVNQELDELALGLHAAFAALAVGGRLAVISFHSLEDREVKHTFRSLTRSPPVPRRVPIRHADIKVQARDVASRVRPGAREIADNPRARSATLRVIEKVSADG